MDFFFNIPPVAVVLFEVSVLASIVALAVFLWRIMPVHRRRRADKRRRLEDNPPTLPASVIVYSNDQAAELEALLPELLGQSYGPGFEVIVVNEGDSMSVRAVVEDMQLRYKNLYLTFTPDGARSLSRKKLAITLGVKAARHPVVVLTAAGARIGSTEWLARIMQHFSDGNHTEVVLGIAVPPRGEDSALWKRTRSFDLAADTVTWLSDAIGGRPWRGTEYNLAYRRDLFFRNKGFSRHLNLRGGDDDIFVSEIARGANTEVELSDQSVVVVPGANSPRESRDRNARRRFTRRFIRRRPRLISALGWWACFTAFAAPVAAVCLQPANGFVWLCAAVCLTCWALSTMVWRNALIAMRGRRLLVTLPLLCAMRPVRKLSGRLTARLRRGKRYTWE